MFKQMQAVISIIILAAFISTSIKAPGYAQEDPMSLMPKPGTMINLTPAYVPVLVKGLKVHPDNPLLFDFILDTGKSGLKINSPEFKTESQKLIKYFLASLTIKEDDLWVNLSPYEKNRIIPDQLGQTELGRDMLAQDYILKQLTASLIYPEKQLGKEFWNTVYAKAQQEFGTSEIPVNTFNKVWIIADKAKILERNNVGYVVGSHLKVMLEEDYLAMSKNSVIASLKTNSDARNDTNSLGSQIVRQIILPELDKEVNQGKNFAPLRQMFYSMILASWYKLALKDALLNQVYSNKGKTGGVLSDDPAAKEKIFQQYLKAYKKGVFNYIKVPTSQQSWESGSRPSEASVGKELSWNSVPRKYFSGGERIFQIPPQRLIERESNLQPGENASPDGDLAMAAVNMAKIGPDAAMKGEENSAIIKRNPEMSAIPESLMPFLQTSEVEDDSSMPKLSLKFKQAPTNDPITRYVSVDPMYGGGFLSEEQFNHYLGTLKEESGTALEVIIQKFFQSEYGHRLRKALGKIGIQNITVDLIPAKIWDDYDYAFAVRHIIHQNDHLYVSVNAGTATNVVNGIVAMINGVATTSWGKDVLASEGLVFKSEEDVLPTVREPSLPPYFVLIQVLKQVNVLPTAASEHLETEAYPYQQQLHQMLKEKGAGQDIKALAKLLWEQLPEEGGSLPGAIYLRDKNTETSISAQEETPHFTLKRGDVRWYIRELRKPRAFRLTYTDVTVRGRSLPPFIDIDLNELFGEQIKALLNLRSKDDNGLRDKVFSIDRKVMGLHHLISRLITRAAENDFLTFEGGARFEAQKRNIPPQLKKIANTAPKQLNAPPNEAMITEKDNAVTTLPPGGIDLNAKNMSMDVTGQGIDMKFDPAMIAEFRRGNFSGIVANIIRIVPIKSVLPMIGLETSPA